MRNRNPRIDIARGVRASQAEVRGSILFSTWYDRCVGQGFRVASVKVSAVHRWGQPEEIKMLQIDAEVYDIDGYKLDGVALLRGDTVDILSLLQVGTETYAVFVGQPRAAGAQAMVCSNPSGMIDGSERSHSAALRELAEETGQILNWSKPVNLAELVAGSSAPLLVSPGASDERVYFYMTTALVTDEQLAGMQGALGGLAHEIDTTWNQFLPSLLLMHEKLEGLGFTYVDGEIAIVEPKGGCHA